MSKAYQQLNLVLTNLHITITAVCVLFHLYFYVSRRKEVMF